MMERTAHRGRGIKKAHVGTILFLMSVFFPGVTSLQPLEQKKCPDGDFLSENGICCNKCSRGFKLLEECHAEGHRSTCTPCPDGQYSAQMNWFHNCFSCKRCQARYHEEEVSPCERTKDRVCRCMAGYYKSSNTPDCRKCSRCGTDEKEKQPCTPEKNTVCECTQNYYKANGKCKPCTNCTAECRDHCSPPTLNTKAPEGDSQVINIIVGAVAVTAILVLLVGLVTYVTTKRFTQQQMLQLSAQPSDSVSPDSCERTTLVNIEELPDNKTVEALLQNPVQDEQDLSKLPDCIPVENTTSDLIYTVLDLVPVAQRKQLLRSLGVTDTEIEQAEMDYRSCREVHYQMLRLWAERGSRAGGGGRILHWPLVQELVDKLRKMHLGRAAEELEIKYAIQ